jgi:DNA damage-binding protein 1
LQELNVLAIVPIDHQLPSFALLFEDAKEARHVRTYSISLKDKDAIQGPIDRISVPQSAHMLIPLPSPLGGFLVMDHRMVMYCGSNPQQNPPSLMLHRDKKVKRFAFLIFLLS